MNTNKTDSARTGVIAGLFHDPSIAAKALTELRSAGFSRTEISQVAAADDAAGTAADAAKADTKGSTGAGEARFFQEHDSHASSFVDELAALGFSKHDAHDLVDGVVEGGAVVTADAKDDVDGATAVLTRNHADVRYAQGTATTSVRDTGTVAAAPVAAAATAVGTTLTEADRVLKLRAEKLAIDKRKVQHGEARIYKEVVTKTQSIDVPVKHEELVIERVAVSGADAADGSPIEAGETIRIPLSEERVDVSKRTVVTGEVTIGKREVTETEHVHETTRSEELRVDDPTTTSTTKLDR